MSPDCCELKSYANAIESALGEAGLLARKYSASTLDVAEKSDGSPVTVADAEIGDLLRELLWRPGEGWLSEEDDEILAEDSAGCTWIVDPIDGTKEFTQGREDWAVSVACVRGGDVIAAGILAPAARQMFIGHRCRAISPVNEAVKSGRVTAKELSRGSRILASRSEVARGSWDVFGDDLFTRVDVGSIAYKLALVSAGLADGTVSLAPKNSWDIAAGVMLVEAAGGRVRDLAGRPISFETPRFKINGLIAGGESLMTGLEAVLYNRALTLR